MRLFIFTPSACTEAAPVLVVEENVEKATIEAKKLVELVANHEQNPAKFPSWTEGGYRETCSISSGAAILCPNLTITNSRIG